MTAQPSSVRERHTEPDAASGGSSRTTWTLRQVILWSTLVVVVFALLAVVPWLGALSSCALFIAVTPLGGRASTRVGATFVLACGALAVALVVGEVVGMRVLSPNRVRFMAAMPAFLAAVSLLWLAARGRRVPLPRLDLTVLPVLLLPIFGWWATGRTALGTALGQEVGGLMLMGWDHQSHFSIFSFLYEQGGIWRSGPADRASMFSGYPPLAGAIGVAMTDLVASAHLDRNQQLGYYVQTAGALFGVAAALLGLAGGGAARRAADDFAAPGSTGGIAAVGATVVGGYAVLGPSFAFFDYGFTNFLFGVALSAAASWLAVVELRDRVGAASIVVIASSAALCLLWTPLVVLVAPAVLLIVIRIVRRRLWVELVAISVLAGVGAIAAAWQVLRLAPTGAQASSLAYTLAATGGGEPAAPLPHLVGLSALAVAGAALFGRRRGFAWWAVLLPTLGAAVLTLSFVCNSLRFGLAPSASYYVAKALWTVYLELIPVMGAVIGLLLFLVAHQSFTTVSDRAPSNRQRRARLGVAGLAAVAVAWCSTPTANAPNGALDYYSLPVGAQAVLDRTIAFRSVPQGDVVAGAEHVTHSRPHRLAIVWDSGDLQTNRWLASLRGDLNGEANAVYSALGGAPYGAPARAALRQALNSDRSLKVVVAFSSPDSSRLLRPLARKFPRRFVLRRM